MAGRVFSSPKSAYFHSVEDLNLKAIIYSNDIDQFFFQPIIKKIENRYLFLVRVAASRLPRLSELIQGVASIVMKPSIDTAPPRLRPSCRALAYSALLGLLFAPLLPPLAMSLDGVEEAPEPVAEPLPDPLETPREPTLSESGYLGGGGVPPSLLTPSRVRIGDFALGGQASTAMVYDDNVEASDDERDEDVLLTFSPSVRAQSIYARHSIGFGAGATAGTTLKDNTDDFVDWRIGADGRIDLSRKSKIDAAVAYSREVEDDEDIDAEDDDGDTPVHNIDARLGYDVGGERLGFGVAGTVTRLEYEGGDFDDRDYTAYGLRGIMRYRWSDDLQFSGGPTYRHSTYDEDVADDGASRDADKVGFQVGAGYRLSRTLRARGRRSAMSTSTSMMPIATTMTAPPAALA